MAAWVLFGMLSDEPSVLSFRSGVVVGLRSASKGGR
jgi:hypothetical protein